MSDIECGIFLVLTINGIKVAHPYPALSLIHLCCGSVTTSAGGSEVEQNCPPFHRLRLSHRWRGRIMAQYCRLEKEV